MADPTTSETDTLQMNWDPIDINEPAQAGWELVFVVDPDISNMVLTLSISPPGQSNGMGFAAITHLEILVRDNSQPLGSQSAGIWGFNTDQQGAILLGNDLLAAGKAINTLPAGTPVGPPPPFASLQNNVMQTVTINLGTGPAAGSATISDGFNTLTGPNYIFPSAGGSLTTATSIEFYENGSLLGSTSLPNVASLGLNNYWGQITLTPEPSSLLLLSIALVSLLGYGRRRRR